MGETGVQTDLAAWLLACVAEDEADAQAATDGPWEFDGDSVDVAPPSRGPYVARFRDEGFAGDALERITPQDGRHIARWDPARVLAECDTKRRIIAECKYWYDKVNRQEDYPALADRFEVSFGILRLLALPYADREGYRAEWGLK